MLERIKPNWLRQVVLVLDLSLDWVRILFSISLSGRNEYSNSNSFFCYLLVFVSGTAVAGPLGFLAGSYLGAKTGKSCGTSRVDEEDDVSISSERGSENHGFKKHTTVSKIPMK